jgi:hypothetical protein
MPQDPVTATGPLFDGSWRGILTSFEDAAVREISKVGHDDVGKELIRVIKKPTGFYESNIRYERIDKLKSLVHDNNVIYGPWLEGKGSRNYPVTRFKGYKTFQRMTRPLQQKAVAIAVGVLPEYLRRLGR